MDAKEKMKKLLFHGRPNNKQPITTNSFPALEP